MKIFRAIEFATRAHRGQYRKGSQLPYIVHPLGVAESLIREGCAEDLVIAGVLHDTIEDCDVTFSDLRKRFGSHVAKIVKGCTEPHRKAPWEERKRHTLSALRNTAPEILTVSLADKLDNARSIVTDHARLGDALWERFKRPRSDQAWYYQGLAEIFSRRASENQAPRLVEEFTKLIKDFF